MVVKSDLEAVLPMAKSSLKDTILKGLLLQTDEGVVRQIAVDAAIVKALEVGVEGEQTDMNDDDRIKNQSIGAGGSRRLSGEEIRVGRPQSASGHGAARMIAEYSEPDPQQDIVVNYEALSRELGDLKEAMKAIASTFGAIVSKAKEDEKEDDKEACKSDALSKADEIDDEDEDEDKAEPFGKSTLSGAAKAADTLIKAAEELDARAKAARKSKDLDRARTLKSKVESTLTKAVGLLASAPDRKEVAVKSMISDIHAFAIVKGFSDLQAIAAKAECDDDEKDEKEAAKSRAGLDENDHNQDKWPAATGEIHNGAAKAEPDQAAQLDAVLKGYAILQGNMSSVLDALAGKSSSAPLKPLDLGLAKSDPAALYKSNVDAWTVAKSEQIAAAVESGEFKLEDELACGTILSYAKGVAVGAVPANVLAQRVQSSNESVRSMFAEVLAA